MSKEVQKTAEFFEATMSCTFSRPQCNASLRGHNVMHIFVATVFCTFSRPQCYSRFRGPSVMHVGSEGSLKAWKIWFSTCYTFQFSNSGNQNWFITSAKIIQRISETQKTSLLKIIYIEGIIYIELLSEVGTQ